MYDDNKNIYMYIKLSVYNVFFLIIFIGSKIHIL